MPSSIANGADRAHRVIPETRPTPAKADLRKPESRAYWAEIGGCLLRAKPSAWTLDMLAAALKRDPRQVRRWVAGEEQTQIAAVFAVEELRQAFVIGLAKLAACEVTTVVTVRQIA